MTMLTEQLPPDVERDPVTNGLIRRRKVFRHFVKADGSVWEEHEDIALRASEAHDIVKRPCVIASPHDSDDEIERKRTQAINSKPQADFLHPRFGWLAGGFKKETEWPENMGNVAQPRERVVTPLPTAPAAEKSASSGRKESAHAS